MKILSPLPHRRGRLEIIPLIDIMFFLLAAFMLVSINKIKIKSLKVNLPTNVPTAQLEKKEDFISVSVNAEGQVQIDKDVFTDKQQVLTRLQALYAENHEQKFLISADKDARNGDVITILGELRSAGFQKIAFSISGTTAPGGSAATQPPPAPPAGAAPSSAPAPAPLAPPAEPAPASPPSAPTP